MAKTVATVMRVNETGAQGDAACSFLHVRIGEGETAKYADIDLPGITAEGAAKLGFRTNAVVAFEIDQEVTFPVSFVAKNGELKSDTKTKILPKRKTLRIEKAVATVMDLLA